MTLFQVLARIYKVLQLLRKNYRLYLKQLCIISFKSILLFLLLSTLLYSVLLFIKPQYPVTKIIPIFRLVDNRQVGYLITHTLTTKYCHHQQSQFVEESNFSTKELCHLSHQYLPITSYNHSYIKISNLYSTRVRLCWLKSTMHQQVCEEFYTQDQMVKFNSININELVLMEISWQQKKQQKIVPVVEIHAQTYIFWFYFSKYYLALISAGVTAFSFLASLTFMAISLNKMIEMSVKRQ